MSVKRLSQSFNENSSEFTVKETVSGDRINPFIHKISLQIPLRLFLFGVFGLITWGYCNSFSKAPAYATCRTGRCTMYISMNEKVHMTILQTFWSLIALSHMWFLKKISSIFKYILWNCQHLLQQWPIRYMRFIGEKCKQRNVANDFSLIRSELKNLQGFLFKL